MSVTEAQMNAAIALALGAQQTLHDTEMNVIRARLTAIPTSTTAVPRVLFTGGTLKISDVVGKFNVTSRSTLEVETSALTLLTMAERAALSPNERSKIQTQFLKGIPRKELHFKAITSANDLKEMMSLTNLVSFDEQQSALTSHVSSISAHGVFYVLKFTSVTNSSGNIVITLTDPDTPAGNPLDLFKCVDLPELDEVIASCDYMMSFGSDFQVENIKWTYDAILNSCDKSLRNILQSKMLKCPGKKFGPVVYWFLIDQLTSADDTIIRSIIDELTNINIADSPGQSITAAVAKIRSAIAWLERVKMVPNDVVPIIKNIMNTCNVPSFVSFFAALVTNAKLNSITFTAESLLTTVEQEYASLVRLGNYDLSTKGGSSFHGASEPDVKRGGGDDKKRIDGGSRQRYGTPSWVSTPPSEGDPTTREFESRAYKWCGVCKRWLYGDRAHSTEEHVPGGPKGYGKNKDKQGNNAAIEQGQSDENTNENDDASPNTSTGLRRNALFFSAGF